MEQITLGQMQTFIVFIASFITSGGIIMGFALKIGKKILDRSLEPFNKKIVEMDMQRKVQHQETLVKINDLEARIDNVDIASVRNRIVAFDNLCRLDINNDNIKMYQYKTFFKDEDIWKNYHTKYTNLNGEIDEAIKNIHKHYESAKF